MALLAATFALVAALPHDGPPVDLQATIEPELVRLELRGELPVVLPWFGLEPDLGAPLTEAEESLLRDRAEAYFAKGCPVEIDGEQVAPTLGALVYPEYYLDNGGAPGLSLELLYPSTSDPTRIGFVWELFEGAEGERGVSVPLVIRDFSQFDFYGLTPEEPEYQWHARNLAERAELATRPLPEVPATGLPLLSIGILGGALGLAAIMRSRGARAPALLAILVLGFALFFHYVDRRGTHWITGVVRPTEEQAREVFEGLHRNMYEAFSTLDEDRVYDLLAVSVAPEILDRTYAEIFESLIQRTEGGAISIVEDVEVLDGSIELDPEEDGLFEAEWHWLVRGVVTHWGHQHRRTNRYRARYLAENDGRGWKIARIDVLDFERMPPEDDGG